MFVGIVPIVVPLKADTRPPFLSQGLATNGMGMLPTGVMEGNHSTVRIDGSIGRWVREGQNRQMTDYEEDAELDNGYVDVKHERGRSTDKRHREGIYEEDARLDHGYGVVNYERGRSTGRRDKESTYEEDARPDRGYGEVKHERGRSGATKNQERGLNSQWVGAPERICLDDREVDWNRDRYGDGRDTSKYQRGRDQSWEKNEWEKETNLTRQSNQRSQSKEMNYVRRQQLASGRK